MIGKMYLPTQTMVESPSLATCGRASQRHPNAFVATDSQQSSFRAGHSFECLLRIRECAAEFQISRISSIPTTRNVSAVFAPHNNIKQIVV
jgi:hypothetical protein